MTEEANWRQEVLDEQAKHAEEYPERPKLSLSLPEGENIVEKNIVFKDNGKQIDNEYGKSLVFTVEVDGVEHVWFVKRSWFPIVNEIAKYDDVTGKAAQVSRTGRTAKDTRRKIVFQEGE